MKKQILIITAATLVIITGCNKTTTPDEPIDTPEPLTERNCAANDMLEKQMAEDPALYKRMQDIETFTQHFIKNRYAKRLLPDSTIEIPVVVNVIYRTATENISLAQIQSQIDVLNEDFSSTNADYRNTPAIFQNVRSGNTGIRFVLDRVIRKFSSKTSLSMRDDAMKKASSGGINATSPATKLNMWVVNKLSSSNGTILGYAQFPGGKSATDGVAMGYKYFGRTGTAVAPYHKGRTATHEVGHWLNLRHIWGNATCGNDQVSDTPPHNTPNRGCPAAGHKSTCRDNPVEMTMNFGLHGRCLPVYVFGRSETKNASDICEGWTT